MPEPDHKTLANIRRAKAAARTKKQPIPQAPIHTPTQPRDTDPSTEPNHKHAATPKTTTTELQRGKSAVSTARKPLKDNDVSVAASSPPAEDQDDKGTKLMRRGMARFEARLLAPGGVSALAAAIRRYSRRQDIAALIPDETLAGMVVAQVKGGLSPGSFGTADRAAFWRLVDAPWSHPSGSRGAAGGMTAEDAADMGKTIQDRVSAAIARAEASGRILAGRSGLGGVDRFEDGLTLDAVVDGEDETPSLPRIGNRQSPITTPTSGHGSQDAHFVSSKPGDDGQDDPAALRRRFLAEHGAAMASVNRDRRTLLDDDAPPPRPSSPPIQPEDDRPRRMRPVRRRSTTDDGQEPAPSDPSWPR